MGEIGLGVMQLLAAFDQRLNDIPIYFGHGFHRVKTKMCQMWEPKTTYRWTVAEALIPRAFGLNDKKKKNEI
jgi:hypothetical protein